MRPVLFAPMFSAPVPLFPGQAGHFDFERTAPQEVILNRIVLDGVGRRFYKMEFSVGATRDLLVPFFVATLRKVHGWRLRDHAPPLVWMSPFARVTITNLGKSACSVQCLLGGWTA